MEVNGGSWREVEGAGERWREVEVDRGRWRGEERKRSGKKWREVETRDITPVTPAPRRYFLAVLPETRDDSLLHGGREGRGERREGKGED